MKKIVILLIILASHASAAYAENYQYILVGFGNGKEVTGFVTSYDNGTIAGTVDNVFVTGHWTGLGSCEVSDGTNFYEMEVVE